MHPERNSFRLAQRRSYVTVRATGILLTILALGHFWLTHIVNDVAQTDSSFISTRWSSVLWITWDGLLLVTTLVHSVAGLQVVIRDYRTKPQSRQRWIAALSGLALVSFLVGTVTITRSVL
jgi:succinate dehydrogenase / fumarate reductase membrane anchor subunit